jgi:ribosome-binding factor A
MKQNRNSRRVNQQAREKLAQIMLFEVADPDLALVTLTGVEVSVDKSVLHAYVSCEPERYETVQAALERAHGRVRSLLGRALGWRVTPELVWEIDTTADDAERIARALQDVPPTMDVEKDAEGYPLLSQDESSSQDASSQDTSPQDASSQDASPQDKPVASDMSNHDTEA